MNNRQSILNLKNRYERLIEDEIKSCDIFKNDIINKLNFDKSINVDIRRLACSLSEAQERFHSNTSALNHINYEIESTTSEQIIKDHKGS